MANSVEDKGVDSEYEDLELPDEPDGRDSIKGLVIPYRSVHAPSSSFKTLNRRCFIPGRPVFAKIIDVERTTSTHLLSPNLYVIQLTHGESVWTIKKRYKHFHHLHQQLQIYRATLSIPFPTKLHRERRSSYKSSIARTEAGKTRQGLPRFPKRPEALVANNHLDDRRSALEKYLQDLLEIRAFRNHHETIEFLEVSHLSFVHGLGIKGKEGIILKRTGTTGQRRCTCGLCSCMNNPFLRIQRTCGESFGKWQRRWLISKDTCVAYVRPKDGNLHCVMLFDREFEVSSGLYDLGVPHGLIISNLSRQLVIKCWTKRKGKEWLEYLRKLTQTQIASAFLNENRFSSFAPIRTQVDAQWFVDGGSYMSAIADVLEAAHEEIFISDWWLSPEIYMKRPMVDGHRWRLDKILERKATTKENVIVIIVPNTITKKKEGVKIFVLLYKEVNLALGINSFYSKQKLVEKSPENIKVLRHPDHVSAGVFLWAHHEKLVIVDQTYAFVAGIDLCYGRWDMSDHRLTDLGSVASQNKNALGANNKKITSSMPGGAMNASSLLQLAKATNVLSIGTVVHSNLTPVVIKEMQEAEIEKLDAIEMKKIIAADEDVFEKSVNNELNLTPNGATGVPGVDFAAGLGQDVDVAIVVDSGEGDSSHVGKSVSMDSKLESTETSTPLKGETPPMLKKNFIRKMTKVSRGLKEDGRDWLEKHLRRKGSNGEDVEEGAGGDKKNEEKEDEEISEEAKVQEEIIDTIIKEKRITKKRATKQNVPSKASIQAELINGLQGSSKLWIGKDYTNFIVKDFADLESPFTDLVDRSSTPRMPWHDIGVMVQGTAARDVARHFIQRWNAVKDEKVPTNPSYPFLLPKSYDFENDSVPPVFLEGSKMSKVSCQVVRSVAQWSCGIRMEEDSIQQSYIDTIGNAKHYIYIENQFFISLASPTSQVQNCIGEALVQRIIKAFNEKDTFRVFIILPLLPGFEGEVGTNRGIAIHAITHWLYASICRGQNSIISKLKAAGIENPSDFITFHGLRSHSELQGDLVTELIYVHSKLLIADDNLVICGSANVNDRSMLGKRDSEVCVVIQDEEFRESKMNGKDYKAGLFAQSLRMHLFREHLGCLNDKNKIDMTDPISDNFYKDVWIKIAQQNTEIYDDVFHCIPSDRCETFSQLREFQNAPSLTLVDPVAAKNRLAQIHGYLVLLPLLFLGGEDLLPSAGTKEGLMPTYLWT